MGIKSTYTIDKKTALAVIVSKITECTNEQLASMLLDFEESHFRNYIVSDELPEDDGSSKVIRTVDMFNSWV